MDLTELAACWGIEANYLDIQGRRCHADPETLRRIVEALSAAGHQPADIHAPARQPEPAYQGDGRKGWVLAVQLYGVRSRRNWGHGDFGDLADLLNIVADLGGAGIGLNPLHAQFYDRPGCSGSPYFPNSRLFLNALYVDVEAVAEFDRAQAASLAADITRLRDAELVDYPTVATVRSRASARRIGISSPAAALSAAPISPPIALSAAARLNALPFRNVAAKAFRRLGRMAGRMAAAARRSAVSSLRESHPNEIGFHEFLQWNAERQLERCREIAKRRGLPIGLYLDTAIGVDGGGADAWMDAGLMLSGLSVGAPPDQFNPAGQDWGITAYNPHGLIASHFEPFRQMLRAAMRHAGAIRIDHVLGADAALCRPARAGRRQRRVSAPAVRRHAGGGRRGKPALEAASPSARTLAPCQKASAICSSAWGVWSYLVVMFERNWDGSFRRPEEYAERAIATFNTHDLPTFAGWMSSHDLRLKQAINVDPGETEDERHNSRVTLCSTLAMATGSHASASPTSPPFSAPRHRNLSQSRSKTCWRLKIR